MTAWLLETLVWTAALIALVLMVRRPVARWFGPQVAYALWALPVLRLALPPIELPAWMAPASETEPGALADQFAFLDPANLLATQEAVGANEGAAPIAAGMPATGSVTPVTGFDFGPMIELGLVVWLIGAAIFLYLRFAAYFRLRDELLGDASEVGRDGKVRLVETHGTQAPLAFGVIDKVIALPQGFLAQPDRTARDLALAHEIAHHKGHDLLINILVQPLFAMHWFNPLGRYGWLALRRDQEAACDARVVGAEPADTRPETREAYANLIVSFAAGPNSAPSHALAAPMACPVLGEKSIIHRLRSLNMTDTPNSRRMAGRLMLGAAVIALPLTASISYAASEAPMAPEAPVAPRALTAPPAPPAPLAPPAPPAPAQLQDEEVIIEVDPDGEVSGEEHRERRVMVIRTDDTHAEHTEGAEHTEHRIERRIVRGNGEMSEEQIEEIMIEVREGLAEADRALEDMPRIIAESMEGMEGVEGRTVVHMECDANSDEAATTTEDGNGNRTVKICQTRIMAHALEGLREAREEIARDTEMSAEIRERVLNELDQQIERWTDREG